MELYQLEDAALVCAPSTEYSLYSLVYYCGCRRVRDPRGWNPNCDAIGHIVKPRIQCIASLPLDSNVDYARDLEVWRQAPLRLVWRRQAQLQAAHPLPEPEPTCAAEKVYKLAKKDQQGAA